MYFDFREEIFNVVGTCSNNLISRVVLVQGVESFTTSHFYTCIVIIIDMSMSNMSITYMKLGSPNSHE